ncbi:TonB-dependent receptor [Methylophaga sp. SB9B]|uniref:TonB-dependent siderophore receptor n=1 Tax=Methylophaga sp. SB9B TaxID=2570356 RepID=UPI001B3C1585|nr:TonB-dependent receptor [Methylophaga sp. SB9B]
MQTTLSIPQRTPIVRAIQRITGSSRHLLLCSALLMPVMAYSTNTYAETVTQSYAIQAGELGSVLNRFASQAGVNIYFDAALTRGLQSSGLTGEHSIDSALQQLLQGTNLQVVKTSADSYQLQASSTKSSSVVDSVKLAPVQVSATGIGGTTEGTLSYTTGSMSTATGLALSQRQTPQSVSVITRQQIEDQNLNDIYEVLEQSTGIITNETGPSGSDSNQIYVRGLQLQGIQVDGVNRLNSYGFSDDLADMVTYDRVEIVRGATGLMSGVGDPSGTINLVRKKPTLETQRSITLKAGSWDNYRTEIDMSGSLSESGNVRGRIVAAYQDSQSYIDRQELEKQVAYGVLEWDVTDQTMLTIGAEYQDIYNDQASNHGFPMFKADGSYFNPSYSFNPTADWTYHKRDSKTFFGKVDHIFDNGWQLRFSAEHSRRSYDDVLGTSASGYPAEDGSGVSIWAGRWAAEPRQTSFDLAVSGKINLFGREHDIYTGASHSKAYHRSYGYPLWTMLSVDNIYTWNGSVPRPDAIVTRSDEYAIDEDQTGVFASVRWSLLDTVSLITGARVIDWQRDEMSHNFSSGAVSREHREENGIVTPYLGLVYDFADNWSAYTSYTTIFNPQSYLDVNGRYIDPKEGENYELGLKSEFWDKRLTAALSIFEVHQDNLAVADGNALAPDGNQAYRAESGTKTADLKLK